MSDKVFGAYVVNLRKYAEGQAAGEWVGFPTTREKMKGVFDRIGINEDYQEVFITDYDIDIYGMKEKLGEYENLDKLNYLAAVIADMNQSEREQYKTVLENGILYGEPGIDGLINLAFNLDGFNLYPEILDNYDLGVYRAREMYGEKLGKIIGDLQNYIDYEDLGRDMQINEGGIFTDAGYILRNNGASWNREYDGSLKSIPDVYKIIADRSDMEKEPVSIFCIRMYDEERYFKNTSGLDAEGLCRVYAKCNKPFIEMEKYGKEIGMIEHACIEQGNKLDFSITFNNELDKIKIFDGENVEYKEMHATLFPEQTKKTRKGR